MVVYPVNRTAVNVGTRRWPLAPLGAGKAQRQPMPPDGGGASVVVGGRESRSQGEGRQQALGLRLECEEIVVE